MLELMKPAGWEDSTEQELLQAIHDKYKDNPTSSQMALLDFINALRKAHMSKPQKILYTFDADKLGSLGIATHKVFFYDAKHPDRKPIGVVERIYSRSETKYGVYHRFNGEKKRAPKIHSLSLVADVTQDLKRAVSFATKYFQPLTEEDVAMRASDSAIAALSRWSSEPFKHSRILDCLESVEEMRSLVEQGVIFKSTLFKDAASKVDSMIEYYRRQVVRAVPMVFVLEHNGLICTGRAEGAEDCRTVAKFAKPEDMPEALYNKYSLLRLTDEDTHMPEVGYRDTGGVCWLFGVTGFEFEKVIGVPSDC